MALETGTYVSDLVTTNPVASDGLVQGDDHIRLLKSTIKNTFSNFTAVALASTQAQIDAAVAATVTGTVPGVINPGTAAAPGLGFLGDLTTGVYRPAAGQVGLAVGGVSSVIASSSGLAVNGAIAATGAVSGVGVVNSGAYSGGTGQLVPIGAELIWNEDTLPAEGGYCWANGGTLSRVGFPLLWARWGTKYGAGDGSTTFNVPNHCEVVLVGQRAMGSASSRALLATGVLGGAPFGAATRTLVAADIPSITSSGVNSITVNPAGSSSNTTPYGAGSWNSVPTVSTGSFFASCNAAGVLGTSIFSGNNTINVTSNNTGAGAVLNLVQPSSAVNYIIRVG